MCIGILDSFDGSFQGYTLGNILGAQFFSSALEAHPEIKDDTENGEFKNAS